MDANIAITSKICDECKAELDAIDKFALNEDKKFELCNFILNLGEEKMDLINVKKLADKLEVDKEITKLKFSKSHINIGHNDFGRDETKWIANILKVNKSLNSFYLSKDFINLGDDSLYTEGAIYISKAMKGNKEVASLELCILYNYN